MGREDDLQKQCARYLDLHGVLWWHYPAEIKAKPQYMAKRKSLGVKAGVPDIMILENRGIYCGLAIELKTKYNKVSDKQESFLEALKMRGWYTKVCYSFEEFEEVFNFYFGRPEIFV